MESGGRVGYRRPEQPAVQGEAEGESPGQDQQKEQPAPDLTEDKMARAGDQPREQYSRRSPARRVRPRGVVHGPVNITARHVAAQVISSLQGQLLVRISVN